MGKRVAMVLAAGLAMGAAHAGNATVLQDIDCNLVSLITRKEHTAH